MGIEGGNRLGKIRAVLEQIKPMFLDSRFTRSDRGVLLVCLFDSMVEKGELNTRQCKELEIFITDYLGEEVPQD